MTGEGFTPDATAVILDTVALAPSATANPAAGSSFVDPAGKTLTFRAPTLPAGRYRVRVRVGGVRIAAGLLGGHRMMRTPDIVVRRVQLRAQRAALYMGWLWAEGATSPDQGLTVTATEVSRLLESAEARDDAERTFRNSDPASLALAEPIREADLALTDDPCWRRLALAFALSDAEADFLCLLLAAAYDDGLARVFAYLHDDAGRILPTPWLAERLFQRPEAHALLYWRLAQPVDGDAARQGAPWRVDPAVAMSLKAGVWEDPALIGCVSIAPADFPCLQPAALDRLLAWPPRRSCGWRGPKGPAARPWPRNTPPGSANPCWWSIPPRPWRRGRRRIRWWRWRAWPGIRARSPTGATGLLSRLACGTAPAASRCCAAAGIRGRAAK